MVDLLRIVPITIPMYMVNRLKNKTSSFSWMHLKVYLKKQVRIEELKGKKENMNYLNNLIKIYFNNKILNKKRRLFESVKFHEKFLSRLSQLEIPS